MYPAAEPRINVRYVELKDGTRVRVIESIPEQRDAVLLVHGWGGSVYSFAETIPAIAAAGYRAIAMDLPGHGLSDKPTDETKYTTAALADTVLAVADALGLRRFTLVGHSMGGGIALELALRGERRLERIVLINPIGLGKVPTIIPVRLISPKIVNRFTPALLGRATIRLILNMAFSARGRPTTRDIEEYWAPTQFDEFAWACRACVHQATWKRISSSRLRALRLPVLVIMGGKDHVIRDVAARAKLIPTAQLIEIPEGGHLVMQEFATRTNAKLLLFLPGGRGKR
jgi:pimeloyl-ACP methyl ester carboxylesterase